MYKVPAFVDLGSFSGLFHKKEHGLAYKLLQNDVLDLLDAQFNAIPSVKVITKPISGTKK